MNKIIPAVLTNNITDFKNKLKILEAFSPLIQIDFMDGKFVPYFSITPKQISKIKTKSFLEAHLMVKNPILYAGKLNNKLFKKVAFHFEASRQTQKITDYFRKQGFQIGLAINPQTKLKEFYPFVKDFDYVLFLSVIPGRQGQKFIPDTLEKIKGLRQKNKKIKIVVDGGINVYNVSKAAKAGADFAATGSSILKAKNPHQEFLKITKAFEEGQGGKKN
ncbi:ribulose-phosphate 3-epimerase [Candidatus Berkelbacteria bacterium]|nr:ribulose-phosphate 3-epimerase [Candidatus Berkelbacteria bacterium]